METPMVVVQARRLDFLLEWDRFCEVLPPGTVDVLERLRDALLAECGVSTSARFWIRQTERMLASDADPGLAFEVAAEEDGVWYVARAVGIDRLNTSDDEIDPRYLVASAPSGWEGTVPW